MKLIKLLFIFITFFLFSPSTLLAVPANPGETQLAQPDGSVFKARVIGDEWNNRVETESGYTIERDNQNTWWHVRGFDGDKAILATTRADKSPLPDLPDHIHKSPSPLPDGAQGRLRFPKSTPSEIDSPQGIPIGNFNGPILFILAEFTTYTGWHHEHTWGDFVTNNVVDYYNKASYGKVNLTPADESSGVNNNGVIGWLNLGYPHPNTAGNTSTTNQQITKDAIIAADPFIDYASYDTNGDNIIDSNELAIVVVTAGFERAYSPNYGPSIWAHKWGISSQVGVPLVDGVAVGGFNGGAGGYAQFGEWHQHTPNDKHQATMGVMVHELGHLIFGLPDLYDTDGSSSGIGVFGLMGAGGWGSSTSDTWPGQTPVLPTAWTKLLLGWVDEIEGTGTELLFASGDGGANSVNTVRKSSTQLPYEYFLAEVRHPSGYDRGFERWFGTNFGGVSITHIDETQFNNNNDATRLVDIEEGDNSQIGLGLGQPTDLWYQGNGTSIGDTGSPNSRLNSGVSSNVSMSINSPPVPVMEVAYPGPAFKDFSVILGGNGFDVALDPSRNQMYVSVPTLNEIVVISTLHYTIIDRILVGLQPHGIDLSHDNNTLYVALRGVGKVAALNLNTLTIETILVSSATENEKIYDVIEAKPNRVFVSANPFNSPGSGPNAHIAMIKTDQGNAVTQVANGWNIRNNPIFQKDPNQQYLYILQQSYSDRSFKLDISQDTAPIIENGYSVLSDWKGNSIISPDGSKIYRGNGRILRTADLSVHNTMPAGLPSLSPDGSLIYIGKNPNLIQIFNSHTLGLVNEISTSCPISEFQQFKIFPFKPGWLILGNDQFCVHEEEKDIQGIPGNLVVIENNNVNSFGEEGGPFSSHSETYTLVNSGGTSLNFNVLKNQSWTGISHTSGALEPGESMEITVTLNSEINSLTKGSYVDTITFTNITNGNGDTSRQVSLEVTSSLDFYSKVLGGDGFDMALDPSRERLYVSVPSLDEIVILSTLNFFIVNRIYVGPQPHGIELSHDNSVLYIALKGTGNIAVLNLDDMSVNTVPVHSGTSSFSIFDVSEAKPNRLFVSSQGYKQGNNTIYGRIALVKLDQNNEITSLNGNHFLGSGINTFLKDPNQKFLYLEQEGSTNDILYKIDIQQDANTSFTTILLPPSSNKKNMDILLSGSDILLESGHIIDTEAFSTRGQLESGVPAVSPDENLYYLAKAPNSLQIYDATTFRKINEITIPCSFTNLQRFQILPDHSGWVILGDGKICSRSLPNQSQNEPGNLLVTLNEEYSPKGEQNGPFFPNSKQYIVSNIGNSAIDFVVTKTTSWIDLQNSTGTLEPGEEAVLTVTLNAIANDLKTGKHNDTLTFSNTTNAIGDTTQNVILEVTPSLQTFSENLGGQGFDMALDNSRNRLYVSVPSLGEIVIISTLDFTIENRITIGQQPHGIDISHDSETLYVALYGTGSIAALDLNTYTISNITIQTGNFHLETYDVVEGKLNRLYSSADPTGYTSFLTGVKTDESNDTFLLYDPDTLNQPTLLKDPNKQFLYLINRFVFKLDIGTDSVPTPKRSHWPPLSNETKKSAINPEGSKIYLEDGQILETNNFILAGNLIPGIPSIKPDGSQIYIGRPPNIIEVFDPVTLDKIKELYTLCPFGEFQNLEILPNEKGWVAMGGSTVCAGLSTNQNRDLLPNDFDGDQDSDLMLTHDVGLLGSGLLDNTALTAFDFLTQVDPAQGWTFSASGDFNGDKKSDVLLYNTTTGEYRILEVDGTTTVSDTVVGIVDPSFGLVPFRMGDFDGDGRAEILIYDPVSGFIGMLLFDENGIFSAFEHITNVDIGNNWVLRDTGDFNGDRRLDLLIYNTVTGDSSIILMNGSTPGPLTPSFILDPATGWTPLDTGDFNGDGRADILAKNTSGAIGVLIMKGTVFETIYVPGGILPGWEIINAGYYNTDDKMDLLIYDTTSGNLMAALQDGATITSYIPLLNLGTGTGWNYHGGKP